MAGRRLSRLGGTVVLDSEGLAKAAGGDGRARAHLVKAEEHGARVVVSTVTLAEVLRGGPRDARVHRVLKGVVQVPVSAEIGRAAGEILGRAGLSGHRCTVDAIVAATALVQARPVLLLTSDPDDMAKLVEEPDVPKNRRVGIVHI
ncbi:PIN domain-containing protein [Nocardiopsis sp. CNT-189]|uniref:type II toxin-antitoxin system VapC family toxin n=1 Tax=Nocardiopsis oceanisediminis TaxID=2816862 RepID=UPI003B2A9791